MSEPDDLKTRVDQFNSLQLPGQPMGMHMGTMYLVNDLWREIERLRASSTITEPGHTNSYSETAMKSFREIKQEIKNGS